MKHMKRLTALLLAVMIIAVAFSGCTESKTESDNKIKIVALIFPEYDWAREITSGSDNVDLTLLLDKGVDMHSFQPTADDMITVSDADVLIYNGGESDSWVQDAIKEANNKDIIPVNLLEALGDEGKIEETPQGAESSEEGKNLDEHIWLSLKNAEKLCTYICEKISQADPDNAELYQTNTEGYIDRLSILDDEYAETVKNSANDTLIFADRFPFRYFCDDYSINYYAAFDGCSAETEASFKTIAYLADKVDEVGVSSVIVTESSDKKIAKTIVNNTKSKNEKILVLNSMQSVKGEDIGKGVTYLSLVEDNLKVLKKALK